jgi:hypothetical protein
MRAAMDRTDGRAHKKCGPASSARPQILRQEEHVSDVRRRRAIHRRPRRREIHHHRRRCRGIRHRRRRRNALPIQKSSRGTARSSCDPMRSSHGTMAPSSCELPTGQRSRGWRNHSRRRLRRRDSSDPLRLPEHRRPRPRLPEHCCPRPTEHRCPRPTGFRYRLPGYLRRPLRGCLPRCCRNGCSPRFRLHAKNARNYEPS